MRKTKEREQNDNGAPPPPSLPPSPAAAAVADGDRNNSLRAMFRKEGKKFQLSHDRNSGPLYDALRRNLVSKECLRSLTMWTVDLFFLAARAFSHSLAVLTYSRRRNKYIYVHMYTCTHIHIYPHVLSVVDEKKKAER